MPPGSLPVSVVGMPITPLLDGVSMGALALVSVGLWTLRVALTARGRSLASASVAALDATVFAVVFGSLLSDLDRPARLGGYAFGVAVGTLLGMLADRRMARVRSEVRVVTPGSGGSLAARLHERRWPATAMAAEGLHGPASVVFVTVDDRCLTSLLDDVRRLAPDAFWTVEPIGDASPVRADDRYIELRSAARP
jgi:uncharacterized protein YebE (UPF0316 family)